MWIIESNEDNGRVFLWILKNFPVVFWSRYIVSVATVVEVNVHHVVVLVRVLQDTVGTSVDPDVSVGSRNNSFWTYLDRKYCTFLDLLGSKISSVHL